MSPLITVAGAETERLNPEGRRPLNPPNWNVVLVLSETSGLAAYPTLHLAQGGTGHPDPDKANT